MKKIIRLAFGISALLPLLVSAGGQHIPGSVFVTPTIMNGNFNVRYNTDPTILGAYMSVQGDDDLVLFLGRGDDGTEFACGVFKDSPLFEKAVQIRYHIKNGSALVATKSAEVNAFQCESLRFSSYSYFQD